jgi:hypothetical protein
MALMAKKAVALKKVLKRPVLIKGSDNGGYIVEVGCKILVYKDAADLVRDLRTYLASPEEHEEDGEQPSHTGGYIFNSSDNTADVIAAAEASHRPVPRRREWRR